MKKTGLILAMSVVLLSCGADNNSNEQQTMDSMATEMTNPYPHIPGAIVTQFMSDYPNLSGVEWETTDSLYMASFTDNGLPIAVMYRMDGVRYGTKATMPAESLPAPVKKAVETLGNPDKVNKLNLADGNTQYEVYIASKIYMYDESGSMVNERNLRIEEETE